MILAILTCQTLLLIHCIDVYMYMCMFLHKLINSCANEYHRYQATFKYLYDIATRILILILTLSPHYDYKRIDGD